MKLTLSVEELQQAVADHITNSGFPVDVSNASYEFSDEGCEIDFGLEETKKPTRKRKNKKQETEEEEKVEKQEEITDNEDTEELTESEGSETDTSDDDEDEDFSVFG